MMKKIKAFHLIKFLQARYLQTMQQRKQHEVFVTERHIQAMWLEQKYFSALHTAQGEKISVISEGIWNLGAGPDFQKAHISIAGKHYFGDIELHLTEDAWYHHHHHLDENYNQVVLHIALWQPALSKPIMAADGKCISQVHLEPFLTVPIKKLSTLIDLDLYPYKEFVGAGRCARELFDSTSDEETASFFQRAADWRLQRKANFLKSKIGHPAFYISGGMSMALGYKNNAFAFLNLFLELKERHFQHEEECLAWLLGKTGFFEEKFAVTWMQNPFYAYLAFLYRQWAEPQIPLLLTQIRPLNHPVRRLVCLAKLHDDAQVEVLLNKARELWEAQWELSHATNSWKAFLDGLESLVPHYTDAYWNKRYLFEAHAQKDFIPLMGPGLKREMVINVIFPFLAEIISAQESEKKAFQQLYRTLSAQKTGKAKYLRHRFFGDQPQGKLLDRAYNVQGAYQLHSDYCFHFEASCEGCPFVEQYKADKFAEDYEPSF